MTNDSNTTPDFSLRVTIGDNRASSYAAQRIHSESIVGIRLAVMEGCLGTIVTDLGIHGSGAAFGGIRHDASEVLLGHAPRRKNGPEINYEISGNDILVYVRDASLVGANPEEVRRIEYRYVRKMKGSANEPRKALYGEESVEVIRIDPRSGHAFARLANTKENRMMLVATVDVRLGKITTG